MNLQQSLQPRSSANGFGRRRIDREIGAKAESKVHSGKSSQSNFDFTANGGKSGGTMNHSRDRLIYVISYLLGLRVEVHMRNGAIISGIFHATNAEKDFAIVLKMAQLIKDGSVRGQTPVPGTLKKPLDMIVQAKDLVQVVAKDVPLNIEEFSSTQPRDKRKDLMIDSAISHSHHLETERELERWTPDADDPKCPEVDDIFNGTWNRNWDQFETNQTLFGVTSTFDEELYTTKLERGPQMRELEREAARIAREIEGEDTRDLHLAEERGIQFDEDLDLDEEIRYSAVQRDIYDHTYEGSQSSLFDTYNAETFSSSHDSAVSKLHSDVSRCKFIDEAHASSSRSSTDVEASDQNQLGKEAHHVESSDAVIFLADNVTKKSPTMTDKSRLGEKHSKIQDEEKNILNEFIERTALEKAQTSPDDEVESSIDAKGPSNTVAHDASFSSHDCKHSVGEPSSLITSAASELGKSSVHLGIAGPSISECTASGVSSGLGPPPSSLVGSLSPEKSTLNPNAKEFKLNPNAKSFTPSASLRPPVPMSEGSFYYPSNLSTVPPIHGVPMGIGIGPSFGGHQPVFSSQSAQLPSPQPYIHPNGPMYGQQVILGQPRPVYYMPTYPPEMPFKGRNF